VLPDGIARAIYLDTDTVVDADLMALWRRDIGDAVAGAAVDYLPRCREAVANWRELGLDGDAPYYNTGVLLDDVHAWRAEDVGARALAVCRQNARHLLAQGKFFHHDQYGLNVVLQGRWHTLGSLWNWGSELVECPAHIVHYLGHGKPHDPRCRRRFRELFLSHLDATPWAGWTGGEQEGRPGPRRRTSRAHPRDALIAAARVSSTRRPERGRRSQRAGRAR
jgi:lipopolysaccharide biosynthesis glycosyltransferase